MKNRTSNLLVLRLFFGKTTGRKLFQALVLTLMPGIFIHAQNTSFNANSIPISGTGCSAFGNGALLSNSSSAFYNTAAGISALRLNTIGGFNTAAGREAIYNNLIGNNNTGMGFQVLYTNVGNSNTAIGSEALFGNGNGSLNTALGMRADVGSSNLTNATAVGAVAIVNMSDAIQLGNNMVTRIFAGVGNNATVITGGLQVTGGTPAGGKVLTSDAAGVATWQWPSANGWSLLGNTGTVDGTNFIGTTDNVPFNIRVNNLRAGRIDHILRNSFYGYQAGNATTTGQFNTAMGMNALMTNVNGNNNTALGYGADVSVAGLNNSTAIGNGAVVTANNSIQLGNSSVTRVMAGTGTNATVVTGGLQVTGGVLATGQVLMSDALGNATWQSPAAGSGAWTTLGNAGTIAGTNFIGTTDNVPLNFRVNNLRAGKIDPALYNVFFGGNTSGVSYPSTGAANSGFGHDALAINTSGIANTAMGISALSANTIGSANSAIGHYALFSNVSGDGNTAIGYNANVAATNLSNATAIGYNATVGSSNSIQLGNSSVTEVRAGTGTATVITAGLKVTGGTPALGKVLTSDALGMATWQVPGTSVASWALSGNAGTIDGTNFIGTTDGVPFNIRVNNVQAGRIDIPTGMGGIYNCNTAFGYQAHNLSGGNMNTSIGAKAGFSITASGDANSSVGAFALQCNTSGGGNTAVGALASQLNSVGYDNTGIGFGVNRYITTGSSNTGCGGQALLGLSTGSMNSALGAFANVSASNLNNATAIGYGTLVNASNKVRLGNGAVLIVEGNAPTYTSSDGRFKNKIVEEDVIGLDFIKKLRPVVYNFDTRKFDEFLTKNMPDSIRKKYLNLDYSQSTIIRQSGFIAQEVEKAAKEVGYDFNGVHRPVDDNDNYSLAYGQFVVPLVKGMQEQQRMIEELQKQLAEQKQITTELQKNSGSSTGVDYLNFDLPGFSMSQNIPNPFTNETVVNYVMPQQVKVASMLVYDLTGKQIASLALSERGASSITITSDRLAAGIYIYTIIGDSKILDSKRMIVADK